MGVGLRWDVCGGCRRCPHWWGTMMIGCSPCSCSAPVRCPWFLDRRGEGSLPLVSFQRAVEPKLIYLILVLAVALSFILAACLLCARVSGFWRCSARWEVGDKTGLLGSAPVVCIDAVHPGSRVNMSIWRWCGAFRARRGGRGLLRRWIWMVVLFAGALVFWRRLACSVTSVLPLLRRHFPTSRLRVCKRALSSLS